MGLTARVEAVFKHGQFVKGPEVAEFERAMATYVGASYAIGCNSGTDALILALKAAGVGQDDFVIVPSFTFQATANAVKWVGAEPVFVDISEDDFNIDTAKVEEALGHGAKAVIAVNMFGIPAQYPALKEITAAHEDCALIEDAAQSMGSRLNRVRSGNLADFGCTSFYPGKSFAGAGDGGMVFTNDFSAAKRIMAYHDHGRQNMTGFGSYWAANVGMNSRLDTIQAAVLLDRLETFEAEIIHRKHQVDSYRRYFSDIPGCKLVDENVAGRVVNYSWFPVLFEDEQLRDEALATYGPHGARVIYPFPLHKMGAFVGYDNKRCPVAESVCRRVLAFPVVHHWEVNRCLCEILPDKFVCEEDL